jgi:adenylate kinase family enzyme
MASPLAPDAPMRRILVVGGPGAGKSTFARRLGARLKLPVVHLDFHYWRSGWRMPALEEWRAAVAALAAAPAWVMDGNYANTFDIRMPRADSLAWLDYPRMICMRRVLWRTLRGFGRTREDLPPGCPEQFDVEFLRFVWEYRARHRHHIEDGIARFGGHLLVRTLCSDRAVKGFLAAIGTP